MDVFSHGFFAAQPSYERIFRAGKNLPPQVLASGPVTYSRIKATSATLGLVGSWAFGGHGGCWTWIGLSRKKVHRLIMSRHKFFISSIHKRSISKPLNKYFTISWIEGTLSVLRLMWSTLETLGWKLVGFFFLIFFWMILHRFRPSNLWEFWVAVHQNLVQPKCKKLMENKHVKMLLQPIVTWWFRLLLYNSGQMMERGSSNNKPSTVRT